MARETLYLEKEGKFKLKILDKKEIRCDVCGKVIDENQFFFYVRTGFFHMEQEVCQVLDACDSSCLGTLYNNYILELLPEHEDSAFFVSEREFHASHSKKSVEILEEISESQD